MSRLIILCGKSACGKDTVRRELARRGYVPLISSTTSPMRPEEVDGVDYNFRTNDEFRKLIEEDRLIEHRSYETALDGKPATWYYGLEAAEPAEGKDYVVVLDLYGARRAAEKYGAYKVCPVVLKVPDWLREKRARARGRFDEAEWARRLKADEEDYSEVKIRELADVVPVKTIRVPSSEMSVKALADTVEYAVKYAAADQVLEAMINEEMDDYDDINTDYD